MPTPGELVPGIMEGLDVLLLPVPAERAAPLLRAAPHLLEEPFTTLQLVWPDAAGRFPWEHDCDPAVVAGQPIVGDPGLRRGTAERSSG